MSALPTREKIFESVHAPHPQREAILEPWVSFLPQIRRFLLRIQAIHLFITLAPEVPQQLLPLLYLHLFHNLFLQRWNWTHLLGLEARWQMRKSNFESNEACVIIAAVTVLGPFVQNLHNAMQSEPRVLMSNLTRCQYFQPLQPLQRSQKAPRLCRKSSTESIGKVS